MRANCRLVAQVLDFVGPHVVPGVSTDELDRLCHDFIVEHGAYPSPLNHKGFPLRVAAHPKPKKSEHLPSGFSAGDIINIDVSAHLNGFHGDTSEMFLIGKVEPEARKLVDATRHSLDLGIEQVGPGKNIGDVGAAIEVYTGRRHGYGVVTRFCGHGIGRSFHMPPQVSPHSARGATGPMMHPGNAFTSDPMINQKPPLSASRQVKPAREGLFRVVASHFVRRPRAVFFRTIQAEGVLEFSHHKSGLRLRV